jgi:hypothetical protein
VREHRWDLSVSLLISATLRLSELFQRQGSVSKVVSVHTIKACGGMEVYLHSFFTLALDVGQWFASRFGRFNLTENP